MRAESLVLCRVRVGEELGGSARRGEVRSRILNNQIICVEINPGAGRGPGASGGPWRTLVGDILSVLL